MNYRRIAAILLDEHGFCPTKRQFSTRITQWGFRKNIFAREKRVPRHSLGMSNMRVIEHAGNEQIGPNLLESFGGEHTIWNSYQL